MVGVWVAAGAAILSLIGVIINVVCTVKGNRKTANEILNLQNEHAKTLEESRQKHQSNLAAVEVRLQVHQQAFTRLLGLLKQRDPEVLRSHARECEIWWTENCLYLSEEASKAYRALCSSFPHQVSYDNNGDILLPASTWALLTDAFTSIHKVPGLPPSIAEDPT